MRYLVPIAFIVVVLGSLYLWNPWKFQLSSESLKDRPVQDAAKMGEISKKINVLVQPLVINVASETIESMGNLLASESVTLRPEIAGRLIALHFSEGGNVKAGQVLFEIERSEYQAQFEQIEAQVRLWGVKVKRGQELLARNLASKQEYDEMLASYQEASAGLKLAQTRLNKTTIKAPFDGSVGLRSVSPGDFLQVGQALVTLDSIDPIKFELRIPERYLKYIKKGQKLAVHIDAYAQDALTGEIYAIDTRVEEASRSVLLRGRLANPNKHLRPGMLARFRLTLQQREQALWAPEQALFTQGQEQFVYRIDNNKALLTKVMIGLREAGRIEILSGLNFDDRVVTDGQMKLHDGDVVDILDAESSESLALPAVN